jgi:hypothetical protein
VSNESVGAYPQKCIVRSRLEARRFPYVRTPGRHTRSVYGHALSASNSDQIPISRPSSRAPTPKRAVFAAVGVRKVWTSRHFSISSFLKT